MRHLEIDYERFGNGRASDSDPADLRDEGDSYIGNGWGIFDSCALAALMSVIVLLLGAAIFLPMSMEGLAAADPSLWPW